MRPSKRRTRAEAWDPTQLTFRTVRETSDRLRALAKKEGLPMNSLIAEAVYIHLHRLETRGDPKLRRKSVCWGCGKRMDAATDGTGRARSGGKRQTKCSTVN